MVVIGLFTLLLMALNWLRDTNASVFLSFLLRYCYLLISYYCLVILRKYLLRRNLTNIKGCKERHLYLALLLVRSHHPQRRNIALMGT